MVGQVRCLLLLHKQGHDEQGHDVHDLDHGVDGGAGSVFVGVAHGVTGDRSLVRIGAFAAVEAVFNGLLGVIPGAAAGGHGDGQEQTRNDGADEHAAQGHRTKTRAEAHDEGGQDRDQGREHHLAESRSW